MTWKICSVTTLVLVMSGCSSAPAASPPAPAPVPTTPTLPPAPWSKPALAADAVPPVYLAQWRAAANRSTCALLAPAQLDAGFTHGATPRAATFSGGWAVAYDAADLRSAFGVAGSGSSAWEEGLYDEWPEKRVYADSSRAGYGLEGGTGPNWLAYVRIPGQQCLYNVWSRRGQSHLEALLEQLRFVNVP
jgi:hypothetical protein